jgi:phage baseplate assembly protein gpV
MSDTSVGLARGQSDPDEEPKKIYGVVRGTVGPPIPDLLMQGRVQVTLHFIDSMDLSAFARVAVLAAGALHGTYFIPQMGDEVLVAFENGDVNNPYIIGSMWTLTSPPPLPTPLLQMRMIRTPVGNQILFTEAPPSISLLGPSLMNGIVIQDPTSIVLQMSGNTVTVTPGGVTLQAGGSTLAVTPAGVVITAPEVSIIGGNIRLN